jgi:hypothetical protein
VAARRMNTKKCLPHRRAALALLDGKFAMSPKSRTFLKQIVFDLRPPSEKQAKWLNDLLGRAGLRPYRGPVR